MDYMFINEITRDIIPCTLDIKRGVLNETQCRWCLEFNKSIDTTRKKIIYNKLHEDIKLKLNDILNNVSKRTESEKVDFKAITKEVELVREKNHAEN